MWRVSQCPNKWGLGSLCCSRAIPAYWIGDVSTQYLIPYQVLRTCCMLMIWLANDPDAMKTMLNHLHCMLRESTLLSIMQSLRWFISIHLVQMCPFSCVWRLLPSSWFSSASSVLRSLNSVLYLGFFLFSWFPFFGSGSPWAASFCFLLCLSPPSSFFFVVCQVPAGGRSCNTTQTKKVQC